MRLLTNVHFDNDGVAVNVAKNVNVALMMMIIPLSKYSFINESISF